MSVAFGNRGLELRAVRLELVGAVGHGVRLEDERDDVDVSLTTDRRRLVGGHSRANERVQVIGGPAGPRIEEYLPRQLRRRRETREIVTMAASAVLQVERFSTLRLRARVDARPHGWIGDRRLGSLRAQRRD